jgi:hypothetical protein
MKKYVILEEQVLDRILDGKCVDGSLRIDKETGKLTFRAFNRKARNHGSRDILLRRMEHGWVKESTERIKVFESLPKDLGLNRLIAVINRDTREVEEVLIDREIVVNS